MFLTMTTSGSLAETGMVSVSSRVSTTAARTVLAKASRAAEAVPVAIRTSRCMGSPLQFPELRFRRRLRGFRADFAQSHLQILAHGRVELVSPEHAAHRFDRRSLSRE